MSENKAVITIQPPPPKDDKFKMPYPYFIDNTGAVMKQDFWKGTPARLIGWTKPGQQNIEVTWKQVLEDPVMAKEVNKLHPVFSDDDCDWFTLTAKCKVIVHKLENS